MATTQLNDMQWRLVRMFSFIKTRQQEAELRKVLMDFYDKKIQAGLDELWEKGILTPEKNKAIANGHDRISSL